MDFAKVTAAAEEGAVMEVKDPAGEVLLQPGDEQKPVWIKFAGLESSKWRKARNEVGNRYIKTRRDSTSAVGPKTTEEAVEDLSYQFAAVTLAWEGIVDEGQDIACSRENAKRLYVKYDFLRTQINDFLGEQRNFWKASSQN